MSAPRIAGGNRLQRRSRLCAMRRGQSTD